MASQNSEFPFHAAEKHDFSASMQRIRPALGTFCSIQATGEHVDLEREINHAFEAIHRVNNLMHPVYGADLSRINRCVSEIIRIDEWTWQVLQLAKQINEMSDGVFDPCLPSQSGCMSDVELFPGNQLICHASVLLDLGGIAKGFAIDRATDVLKAAGCSGGLVNAGGDARVFGKAQVMHIPSVDRVMQLHLDNQALAVSTMGHPDRPGEHQGYYLRISEATSVHHHAAVIAEHAVVADALTKCVIWMNIEHSKYVSDYFHAQVVIAE